MSYVQKQLSDGERIVFQTTLHPIIFLWPVAVVAGGVSFFGLNPTVGSIGVFLGLLLMLSLWITYKTSEFAVTNRRVIIKTGLVSRKTIETLLTKVEGVQVDQDILGRILNYGTLTVTGTGGTHEPFKRIRHPLEFRKQVQEGSTTGHATAAQEHLQAALQVGGAPTSQPAAPPQEDIVSQLERLGRLRENGTLSAEEFEDQKKKLLAR